MRDLMKSGDIVTVNSNYRDDEASNTYIIHKIIEDECLLYHPIYKDCFIIKKINEINHTAPIIKDSSERSLDFVLANKDKLGYNSVLDLKALCLVFAVERSLGPRFKNILAALCGNIAAVHFNNNVDLAITYVVKNAGVLDDFNRMWYYNFAKLFSKKQPITSKKQRTAIFNIAGFVLAELEAPSARV